MAKEVAKKQSSGFGVWSAVLGTLSVMLAILPIFGAILGLSGIYLSFRQNKISKTDISRFGRILSIIGLVSSVLIWIFSLWILGNPEILAKIMSQVPAQ